MIENKVYPKLKEYVKVNRGFSMDKLKEEPIYQEYLALMDTLKSLNKQKVKLTFTQQNDWSNRQGQKQGKIIVNDKGQICFFEGRCTRKGYYLDAGLFDGWFATLIPLTIDIL